MDILLILQAVWDALLDSLDWLIGLAGVVVVLLLNPARLTMMFGSFLANTFMRVSTLRGMRQAIDFRMLPFDHKARTAQKHRENALNRRTRMNEYRDMRRIKKADREGPYAIQQMIEDLFDVNFQRWQQLLKNALVEYDRREEVVHRQMYALKWRNQQIWEKFEPELEVREMELMKLRIKWSRAINHLQSNRKLRAFWKNVLVVRKQRMKWKQLNKQYVKKIKLRNHQMRKQEKICNILLQPNLAWLHDFEEQHLRHSVVEFQADWASAQLTAETGRTLGRLLNPRSGKAREVRGLMKLEHLPHNEDKLFEFLKTELQGRVGLNPNSQLEDMFETWLRMYYADLGPEKCPALEPLGSHGFYLWVCQLVPPGAKGLANMNYMHGPHEGDTLGWLELK